MRGEEGVDKDSYCRVFAPAATRTGSRSPCRYCSHTSDGTCKRPATAESVPPLAPVFVQRWPGAAQAAKAQSLSSKH